MLSTFMIVWSGQWRSDRTAAGGGRMGVSPEGNKVSTVSYTQIGNSMALDWGGVGSHQSHMLSTETSRRVKSEGHCEI